MALQFQRNCGDELTRSKRYRRTLNPVHRALAVCGEVKTHIVAGVSITDRDRPDITQFKKLLAQTARHFSIREVLADKAYSSREMIAHIDGLGVQPYIPFKINSKATSDVRGATKRMRATSGAWDRLFHLYNFQREEFLAHYHKRSNVESALSSMKRKFGDFIRSKTPTAQTNEALLKILAHNLVTLVHSIFELGVAPMLERTTQIEEHANGRPLLVD